MTPSRRDRCLVLDSPFARGLTPREHEIATLVASGRTNGEIAAALDLSVKTVEWNLTKVYRVLRVRGRTELAATWARDGRSTEGGTR